jgi:hypothetical protein
MNIIKRKHSGNKSLSARVCGLSLAKSYFLPDRGDSALLLPMIVLAFPPPGVWTVFTKSWECDLGVPVRTSLLWTWAPRVCSEVFLSAIVTVLLVLLPPKKPDHLPNYHHLTFAWAGWTLDILAHFIIMSIYEYRNKKCNKKFCFHLSST